MGEGTGVNLPAGAKKSAFCGLLWVCRCCEWPSGGSCVLQFYCSGRAILLHSGLRQDHRFLLLALAVLFA